MQVTEISADGLKREFQVVVPAQEIEEQVTGRLEEIGRTARLPGFRPGKTPFKVLKQRFGSAVLGEVLQETVQDSSQKTIEDRDLKPALQPKVDIKSFEEGGDLAYGLTVEVLPEITPVAFSSISLEKLEAEVPEEEVQKALDRISAGNPGPAPDEHAAADGDTVAIDFVGKTDGEPFPGGSAEGYRLRLGSKSFIPGFEEQVVGMRKGDQRTIEVSFPEDYGAEQLAGKAATFDVTVKEVLVAAPLDDELAKKIGAESLDALRQSVRDRMMEDYTAVARTKLKRRLFDALESAHTFPLPEGLVNQEFDTIWEQVKRELDGPRAEEVRQGKDDDTLTAEYRAVAERRVRLGLLLAEVGRVNNISVSQEDLGRVMRAEIANYPGQEQQVFDFYQKNPEALARLQAPVLEDKVVDFILEQAAVTKRPVTLEELMREEEEETPTAAA